MLKEAINELTIDVDLECTSPLLIKDGRLETSIRKELQKGLTKQQGERLPSAVPISRAPLDTLTDALRAFSTSGSTAAMEGLPFFIPGSSLRGSWRSHLETAARSLHDPGQTRVCDPVEEEGEWRGCSTALVERRERLGRERGVPYRHSCPICRLFGNTEQAGRIWISDGVMVRKARLGVRDHVAINRKTGGPMSGKLFSEMVIEGGVFRVRISLRNFELSHVFLLSLLLLDIQAERIALGSAKSRGYGRTKFSNGEGALTLTRFQLTEPAETEWTGAAEARGVEHAQRYGVRPWGSRPLLPKGRWERTSPWRWERSLKADSLNSFASYSGEWLATMNDAGLLSQRVPPPEPVEGSTAQ